MIYQYTLAPIESVLEAVFIVLTGVTNSYFMGLVLLALVVRLATKPLERYASRAVSTQAEIESVLAPQIDAIKQKYTASQRHEAIKRLYARYGYHPVYAIRALAGLGVQLPFFIAAYFMLSDYPQLVGRVVPLLGDLGKPDTLLFGSIHLMPFVMTLVNVLALVTAPGFTRKSLIQGLFISLIFLVLLYNSPLALLIYWTTSNLFSLISNYTPAISEKLKLKKTTVKFKDTLFGRRFEEYAYLFFVTNLAILIPLLGVLGDQFNFFTAHSMPAKSIVILLLTIALAPPLILFALRWLSKRVRSVKVFDGVVLFVFLGLFLFYSLNKIGYGFFPAKHEPYILFVLALVITFAAVVFILKNKLLRNLSYLSLIIPLVFLNFIFVSPASTLFKQSDKVLSSITSGKNDTPVFLLIFDEFSGLTLQNLKGELDASRYPGFAELAAQADYFPNALTARLSTDVAIPSIASGNLRDKDNPGLAPGANLIELFQAKGSVYAQSTVLPADLMSKLNINQASFISDLATLYLHIISHQDWIEKKIGAIPESWKGFGVFFKEDENSQDRKAFNPHTRQFIDWMDQVNNDEISRQFNFLHIQFPHIPYNVTSLGQIHNNGTLIFKKLIQLPGGGFYTNQPSLNVIYHSYMQQSAYIDSMILDFIKVLKNNDLFDKSLIIITSDHGVSYNEKGISRRWLVNKNSWKNVVSVPLFIKYPYQKQGTINTSFVTTLDLSTTILNVTGIDSPWESIGQNLKGIKSSGQTRSVELIPGYMDYFKNINIYFQEARVRKENLFSEKTPVNTIAVNYTENPVYSALLKREIAELRVVAPSNLHATWGGSLKPWEVSRFGTIYQGTQPANNKVIAVAVNGKIQAICQSGKAREQDGFFAFSLPEKKGVSDELKISLYEIVGNGPFNFKEIETSTLNMVLKKEFSQRKKKYTYDWKNSVQLYRGLDALNARDDGIQILSTSKDPFVVFKLISQNAINEPIFHIRLESNRELTLHLYYQTAHMLKFNEAQRIKYVIKKGSNSIYIKIPEKDFTGPFRIDTGNGGATEVIIKSIELRD